MTLRTSSSLLELMRDAPLVRIPPYPAAANGAGLWAQLELALPGAMKDRVAVQMIEAAEAAGHLHPGDVIVESSSGTMAEGLARVGAIKGYTVIIVTDPRIDVITLAKLRALGTVVEIVEHYDRAGGWQLARLRRLREVLERYPRAFWARQYDSPENPNAYTPLADAIADAFQGSLAALVGTVGSGGSMGGLARALRRRCPDLQVIAVDAVGSVLFNQPAATRLQSGHGNNIIPGNLDYTVFDDVHWLSDGEAFAGCHALCRATGIFGGGSSGAAYIVASWVAARFAADRNVVVVFPDRGDRYAETVYSEPFLREHGLLNCAIPPAPLLVEYGVDVVDRWSYAHLPHDGRVPYHHPDVKSTGELARALGLAEIPA